MEDQYVINLMNDLTRFHLVEKKHFIFYGTLPCIKILPVNSIDKIQESDIYMEFVTLFCLSVITTTY